MVQMASRGRTDAPQEMSIDAFVEMSKNPELFAKRLGELRDAENKAVTAAKEAAARIQEAHTLLQQANTITAKQNAREAALTERENKFNEAAAAYKESVVTKNADLAEEKRNLASAVGTANDREAAAAKAIAEAEATRERNMREARLTEDTRKRYDTAVAELRAVLERYG